MKVPVIRAFVDKSTSEPYNQGSIFESTDADRIKELQEKGFLLLSTLVAEKDKEPPADPPKNEKTNEPDPPNS